MPLKVVRRKGSAHFYVRGTVRGQVVFETTETDNRELAEAHRIKRESGILERSIFGFDATITFAEAAASYLEAGGEARFLGRFDERKGGWTLLIGHFTTTPIGRIGQGEIDDAARSIYPGTAASSRKRMVYVPMCAVLHHAARKGWCRAPLIQHPKVKEPTTRWATPEYVESLLGHCSAPLRRLVVFLVYTGARLSEALAVDWDRDIDLSQRSVVLRLTKNGKMRTVYVPDPLLTELAGVPEARRRGALFHWSHKSHVHKPLRHAAKQAGLDYMPPHQLGRHTFATWLRIYAGLDLIGLKQAGGWDSLAAVERYAHVVPNEAARAVTQMPNATGRTDASNLQPAGQLPAKRRAK